MRVRGLVWLVVPVLSACRVFAAGPAVCRVVEGEVLAGQMFRAAAMAGVEVRVEPIASGWVLRVVPTAHAGEDWAETATPPYRSVSPLRVSTEYSFRAQDAVGWNPRRFRFAASEAAYEGLRLLRQGMERGSAGDAAALAELASRQPEGTMEVLDAHLVPGTADQTRAAGAVAVHFRTTAHALEQPVGDGPATPLGQVTWMRFRVELQVTPGARAGAGGSVARQTRCGGR